MTPEISLKLRKSLIKHEGYRNFIYTDSVGKLTGGIGYNFSDRGLSDTWINEQFSSDIEYLHSELSKHDWFNELNEDRQVVLCDMSFMGLKRLMGFVEMIAALERKDYDAAADEMLNSEWAKEVKGRAEELANGMRTGVYNV